MIAKNYLVFGAGAVGTTVAAWLNETDASVSLYVRSKSCASISQTGLTTYHAPSPSSRNTQSIAVYDDLNMVPTPDVIILCVKNYSLDAASKQLLDAFGDNILLIALQNGVDNQHILPHYFKRIIYGVVAYNAWLDDIGCAGYQKKGPLALGHLGGVTYDELSAVCAQLNQAVETVICENFNDAAHSKIVINLTNSLTTLVASHLHDQSNSNAFHTLLTRMTYEGMSVMKAAGYKESKLGGMPSWALLRAAALLPKFITRRAYVSNLKKMVISSMAQDVIINGSDTSELESINGYVIALAQQHNIPVPVNRAVYHLCKQQFELDKFYPLSAEHILAQVTSG